jgi:glucokinase
MATYAGVDLGATNVRVVVGDETGTVISTRKTPTPQGPSGIAVIEAILDALRDVCDDAGVHPKQLEAVGIGSFGPLHLAEGAVVNPANLPDEVERIPLTGPIKNLIGSDEVYLHNDTTVGAIGERFYSDRNPDDMVYLTISTGIGAGVCVDGNVLHGWDGNAGEVGHTVVDPDGFMECGCGTDGHWEAYCSGNNIPRFARQRYEESDLDTSIPVDDPDLEAADVFAAADEGDEFALDLIERMARWNAIGIANLVHSYAPLVVYVGGAVTVNNPEHVLEPVQEVIDDMVMINVPEVRETTLGGDVVVKGALASALTSGTGDHSKVSSH